MNRPSSDFNSAKDRVTLLKAEPDNDVKLQLYALFKQSTVGQCNVTKPGAFDFIAKAKWNAWSELNSMTQDAAEQKYIDLVNSLVVADGGVADGGVAEVSPQKSEDRRQYETLLTDVKDGIFRISLNRPSKLNAITHKMYEEWIEALEEAAQNDEVKIAVTTGVGDYYCSGNDLNNFSSALKGGQSMHESAVRGGILLGRFVKAFIDFPKPLLAVVNGPAVGVSVTVMGMYDAVYASDKATFHTPFTILGQSAEGCSSFTFPRIMGHTKACGMLLFNEKITAQEAFDRGFINEVIPHDSFKHVVEGKLSEIAKLPKGSLSVSKNIIRDVIRSDLHAANDRECDTLVERWQSKECMEAVMSFVQRKSKM